MNYILKKYKTPKWFDHRFGLKIGEVKTVYGRLFLYKDIDRYIVAQDAKIPFCGSLQTTEHKAIASYLKSMKIVLK